MMTSSTSPSEDRVLITGATGFLGNAVVSLAIQQGLTVRCTGRAAKPKALALDYVQADLLTDDLDEALEGITVLIHIAGLAHVFDKSKSEEQFMAVNAHATERLAQAAFKAGVKHMVLASSVAVYGGNRGEPSSEQSPCHPASAYARSKFAGEKLAAEVAGDRMSLTILRLATLFGPGDPGNVARLMASIDRGRFVWIGRGENLKSLVYRDDAAQACLDAALAPARGVQIYNVSARAESMKTIVNALSQRLAKPLPRWHVPAWLAQGGSKLASSLCFHRGPATSVERMIRTWLADDIYPADLIQQELGWHPQMPLEAGLASEVDWYLDRKHSSQPVPK